MECSREKEVGLIKSCSTTTAIFWSQKILSILHIIYDLNLGVISVDESRYNGSGGGCGGCGEREELEIRAKLFLQDFDSDSAADSIEAVLKHIGEELFCIQTEVCGHGQIYS